MEIVINYQNQTLGHHMLLQRVLVEVARGVHDEDRPAEKLVRAMACRPCTSRSALQARWNN
jgi:hypothetical protein